MAIWPIGLPQAPEPAGYSNKEDEDALRSPMGYGPDKVRQLTTFAVRKVTMQFFLEQADMAVLDNFYKVDLKRALEFDWIDHTDNSPAVYRFVNAPVKSPYGNGNWWDVTLNLEIIG